MAFLLEPPVIESYRAIWRILSDLDTEPRRRFACACVEHVIHLYDWVDVEKLHDILKTLKRYALGQIKYKDLTWNRPMQIRAAWEDPPENDGLIWSIRDALSYCFFLIPDDLPRHNGEGLDGAWDAARSAAEAVVWAQGEEAARAEVAWQLQMARDLFAEIYPDKPFPHS